MKVWSDKPHPQYPDIHQGYIIVGLYGHEGVRDAWIVCNTYSNFQLFSINTGHAWCLQVSNMLTIDQLDPKGLIKITAIYSNIGSWIHDGSPGIQL
jgi:hypothetical protein